MATRSAALPIERSYLTRAWLAVAAVIVVAAAAIAITIAMTGRAPAGGTQLEPITDYGPAGVQQHPILVGGSVCEQCR